MNAKTLPAKKPTHSTRKSSYAAKLETIRRKEHRNHKQHDYGKIGR